MISKVTLGNLPTGVPGLDTLLGGGIPRYSFVLINGAPGSGKTSLAHQIMFFNASAGRRALFFTVLGEPPLKMLRYQQQYSYFDIDKIGTAIKYVSLTDDLGKSGLDGVLERILTEVDGFRPELVFIDSFKSIVQAVRKEEQGRASLQHFVQRLSIHAATWQTTTFLLGEYSQAHRDDNPIFTIADGVIHLCQESDDNAVIRKVRVVKMRGAQHMMGMHSLRIAGDGLHVYPRLLQAGTATGPHAGTPMARLSTGCRELDAMLGGGIPEGYSILLAGLPGCGKTMLATAFLAAGSAAAERGLIASFEHIVSVNPNPLLQELLDAGSVSTLYPLALDMSIEEFVMQLESAVERTGARRVVIDSLNALELVLAPQYRKNFHESLFRLLSCLRLRGVTILMTRNVPDVTSHALGPGSFIVDGIITMHYVETDRRLIKLISVPKLRGSSHGDEVRSYRVHARGIAIDVPDPGALPD